ncbi:hypothetical protein [Daejeonella sp.]|uniref:hypothetical protein n=1 Tax=Daejeonella sp. TaxID=2805397 RepID=UPI0027213187|nr:hypothetical protein [Daejeonella sp.]MDO8991853.1 hypothetical protein [Daejeonella sp.]MDP2413883.1 hypothetical protein [Daejeonella sp.]
MKTKTVFFDIKGFFEAEVKRLTSKKSTVNKSVRQNDQAEIKKNLSVDWDNELALFIASDIIKPAWKDSYKISGNSLHFNYIAIDTNLRTRSVEIKKDQQGRAVFFKIKNLTRSKLYESSEELTYIPDSIYTINKSQSVRFLGNNTYQISGIVLK